MPRIENLEIFDAAILPQYDADIIVKNMSAIPEKLGISYRIPLVVGHDEDGSWLKDSGYPAAGWLENIRKVGSKIVATVTDVPKKIAELITARAYRTVSPEIYTNFGGTMGPALRRVALLGGQIPHIKTLDDVMALYAEFREPGVWHAADEPGGEYITLKTETDPMDEKEMQKKIDEHEAGRKKADEEHAAAVKKYEEAAAEEKKKAEATAEEVKKLTEASAALGKELEGIKEAQRQPGRSLDNLKKFVDKGAVTEAVDRLEEKSAIIDSFIEQQVRAGKLTPAEIDAGLKAHLMALDDSTVVIFGEGDGAKKKTMLESALDLIVVRKPIVKLGETAIAGAGGPLNDGWKTDVIDPATGEKVERVRKETLKYYLEHREEFESKGMTLKGLAATDQPIATK